MMKNHLVLLDDCVEQIGGIEEMPRSEQREAHRSGGGEEAGIF